MPQTVVAYGPDYRALRAEKLGVSWDQDIDLSGVPDEAIPSETVLPETVGEVAPAVEGESR